MRLAAWMAVLLFGVYAGATFVSDVSGIAPLAGQILNGFAMQAACEGAVNRVAFHRTSWLMGGHDAPATP